MPGVYLSHLSVPHSCLSSFFSSAQWKPPSAPPRSRLCRGPRPVLTPACSCPSGSFSPLHQLHPLLPFPQPRLPSMVFFSNPAALRVPINPLSPMLTLSLNISETKRPKPLPNPCPLSLFLDQEYPIPGPSSLAELTPQTDNWQHSPAAALPTHLRGHDGLRKEGRQTQPNLTCDREPGAWAEIPLIGAQSPSPARKPLSAQPLALRVPAPGSSAGRGPGARVRPSNPPRRRCRARGHSPTTVSRLPAPKGRRRL